MLYYKLAYTHSRSSKFSRSWIHYCL